MHHRSGSSLLAVAALAAAAGVSQPPTAAAPSTPAAVENLSAGSAPSLSTAAARRIPAGTLRVVVSGERLGKKAVVKVRGLSRKARKVRETATTRKRISFTGLPPGTYRVRGKKITNSAGRTSIAEVVKAKLSPRKGARATLSYAKESPAIKPGTPPNAIVVPPPVANLRFADRSATSLALQWDNPPGGAVAEVIVRRAAGASAPTTPDSGQAVATQGSTPSIAVDSGLASYARYSYSVFTKSITGHFSQAVTVLGRTRRQIAAGASHTCATTDGGGVACWGADTTGQLGNGAGPPGSEPSAVSGVGESAALTKVSAVAAGGDARAEGTGHTCALLTTSQLVCWGNNNQGQIGDGTTTNRTAPVYQPDPLKPGAVRSGFTAVSAGAAHTCAIRTASDNFGPATPPRLYCWGRNADGQLGDGTTTDRLQAVTPVVFSGQRPVAAVAAGSSHTCALLIEGSVECWGSNSHGQLGNGTATESATPVPVSGLGPGSTKALAAGGRHTCALLVGGSVACWGSNDGQGQLGTGGTGNKSTPTKVVFPSAVPVTGVSTGIQHSCSVQTDGVTHCWGDGSRLQVGSPADWLSPLKQAGITSATTVASGAFHNCITTGSDDSVRCWGWNKHGQASPVPGSGTLISTPATVAGL